MLWYLVWEWNLVPPLLISREALAQVYERNKANEHESELFEEHDYLNCKKKNINMYMYMYMYIIIHLNTFCKMEKKSSKNTKQVRS